MEGSDPLILVQLNKSMVKDSINLEFIDSLLAKVPEDLCNGSVDGDNDKEMDMLEAKEDDGSDNDLAKRRKIAEGSPEVSDMPVEVSEYSHLTSVPLVPESSALPVVDGFDGSSQEFPMETVPVIPFEEHLAKANDILQGYVSENHARAVEIVSPEDFAEVTLDSATMVSHIANFHQRAAIFFFTGRVPFLNRIKDWLSYLLKGHFVEKVFDETKGFFEVLFSSQEARDQILKMVPLFLDGQLVHVVPWKPMVDFQDVLRQACPIWVDVVNFPSAYWDSLSTIMGQLGEVLVAPKWNARNRNRLCMLWDTGRVRPHQLRVKAEGFDDLFFELKWGSFVGHCFKCGELGHFFSECPVSNSQVQSADELIVESQEEVVEPLNRNDFGVIGGKIGIGQSTVFEVGQSSKGTDSNGNNKGIGWEVPRVVAPDKGKQVAVEESGGKWTDVVKRGNRTGSQGQRNQAKQQFPIPRPQRYNLRSRGSKEVLVRPLQFDHRGVMSSHWDRHDKNNDRVSTQANFSHKQVPLVGKEKISSLLRQAWDQMALEGIEDPSQFFQEQEARVQSGTKR